MDWDKKWLVDFNGRKTQVVLFNQSNNTGAIDVKMDGSVFEEESFKMVELIFSSKLDWGPYIIYIAKTTSKKIVNSFFPCTARLWNSLPIECFPLTYYLNGFKV